MLIRSAEDGAEQPQPLLMAIEAKLAPVLEFVLGRWKHEEFTAKSLHRDMTPEQAATVSDWLLANRHKTLNPLLKVRTHTERRAAVRRRP